MNNIEFIKDLSIEAFEFLSVFSPDMFEDGRVELAGGVYVNIESYQTQERCKRRFEAHRKYIDIQYMIEGEELIAVAPISELTISEPYDEKRDIEFYENSVNGMDYALHSGEFQIFKPGEGHMPCIALNGINKVRKMVIKVPIVAEMVL